MKNWILFPCGSYYDLANDSNNVGMPKGIYGQDWLVIRCRDEDDDVVPEIARWWQRDGEPSAADGRKISLQSACKLFVEPTQRDSDPT